MRAAVIAIGDELVSGARIDTNSAWLSQRLVDLGVAVLFQTAVGDDLEEITATFRLAQRRADVVVCTGGLGPTADDLTRHAIAAATGRTLQMDPETLDHIRRLFARFGRQMPSRNEIQAMFPEGSRIISNPHGTAPGIDVEVTDPDGHRSRTFALPGVPAEMRQMWNETVEPALHSMGAGQRTVRRRRIKCFGAGESALEQMLPDLTRRGRTPTVGITVHKATITLSVTADGASVEACEAAMQPTIETIHRCLGDLVFGEEDDELQHVVVRQLRRQKMTLATAEWGTDGIVAHWLRTVPEATTVYRGGFVVPSWAALSLAMAAPQLSRPMTTESSAQLTRQASESLRKTMQADFGLAVGPRSGLDAGNETPKSIHIALATHDDVRLVSHRLAGHPDIVMERSAKQALNFLRLILAEREAAK